MTDRLVQILDGNTFVVSDSRGDIEASLTDPTGLFSFDSRFLSTWILTVDGQRLNPLSIDDLQYFESRFFLVPGTGTVYVDAKLSVIRRRAVGDGFHEELTILNHDAEPVELTVRVEAASDFADLFEVKDALKKKGKYSATVDKRRLLLTYERDTFKRQTAISASAPARIDERGLTFEVDVAGHGSWTTDLDVVTAYPIRPYDTVMQAIAKKIANGQLVAEYIVAEGEHSQFEIVKHACAVGARVFVGRQPERARQAPFEPSRESRRSSPSRSPGA